MSLHEERNEQNKPTWRTHFERERVDLSASVEAALMDNSELAQQWLDEFDELDGSETGGTALVPPRLSLQSIPVPVVLPKHQVSNSATTQQMNSSQVVEAQEQRSAPVSQPSGMLTRLARRFTASFTIVKPEMNQSQALAPASEPAFISDTRAYPQMPYHEFDEYAHQPLVRVIDTVSSSGPIVEGDHTETQKRHSLKRNGKVRLETTEMPAIPKKLQPPMEEQQTGEALLIDVRDALDQQQASFIVSKQRMESEEVYSGKLSSAARVPLSGSGVFEPERGDVMVPNIHITSASVVLVTLTTNPGPIVVQYVSLHPQVGFTVHLTAPVSIRTTFNYVIMLGEVF